MSYMWNNFIIECVGEQSCQIGCMSVIRKSKLTVMPYFHHLLCFVYGVKYRYAVTKFDTDATYKSKKIKSFT